MEAEERVRRADVWLGVRDSRQAKKVEHDRVDLRGVAVCAVLSGADPFVEIEAWGKEKRDWLRKSLSNPTPHADQVFLKKRLCATR